MYKVVWRDKAKESLKEIARSDWLTAEKIRDKVEDILPRNPYLGKPLTGKWKGCWRITFGRYRIIYEIQEVQLVIIVLKVGHRKEVY